ncbi:zinc finger BED domain-containing protein 6-like [Octopus sinensis]|uniref:Zinc finger BED domain-containing protein 6-like n=1 Tax=Octopus sinensis TaxID=2607531 RepID=A0A6P7TYD5_9MOLL|nr:zinc finger BED domain-containing protein 6-like [Octopus sinensis]
MRYFNIKIEQRKALATYAIDNNLSILSDIQWITAEKIVKILKPFEEITIEASKRSATASMIIPSIKTILLFLEKAKESCEFYEIKETTEKLMSSIDKRFTFYFENESLCITTTLDPRFKTRFHKTCMIERIKKLIVKYMKDSNSPDTKLSENAISLTKIQNSETLTFEEIFSQISSSNRIMSMEKNYQHCYLTELQNYLELDLIRRTDNIFTWWKNFTNIFPRLSKMALKYLTAPASSVESERVFSTGRNIYQPKRNRLLPENGEMMMYLHII